MKTEKDPFELRRHQIEHKHKVRNRKNYKRQLTNAREERLMYAQLIEDIDQSEYGKLPNGMKLIDAVYDPEISEELKSLAIKAKDEWSKQENLFERKLAFIVGLLDDSIPTHMPSNYPIRPQIIDIPTSYSGKNISDGRRFDLVQEATMLNDNHRANR